MPDGLIRVRCEACGRQRVFRQAELFLEADRQSVTLRKACPGCGHAGAVLIERPSTGPVVLSPGVGVHTSGGWVPGPRYRRLR